MKLPANLRTGKNKGQALIKKKTALKSSNFLLKYLAGAVVFLASLSASAASPVDFFATESTSADENMIRMTTDLFFSQFQTLDGYTVNDRRKEHYSSETGSSSAISFYAEIQESADGQWLCTLNAVKNRENKNVSSTKKYESYYKILLDAKPSLENLLLNLSGNIITPPAAEEETEPPVPQVSSKSEIEIISGTWGGEKDIEKILILRGGKGFVIFRNGASMNVEVIVSGRNVTVRQTGRSNASFFPDIPRQTALKKLSAAEPVEWNLTLTDDSTLSGKKRTMMLKEGTEDVFYGESEVTWRKK